MYCHVCGFEGALARKHCTRCKDSYGKRVNSPEDIHPFTEMPTLYALPSIKHAQISQTLYQGRYHLRKLLTQAGEQQEAGETWLALDTSSSNPVQVVIREIAPNPRHTPEQQKQALHALVWRMTQLGQCPGIHGVIDFFRENERYYLVQQYIAGMSLAMLLKRRGEPIFEPQAAEYGRQLCSILAFFAHLDTPFIHGFISPQTVFVSTDHTTLFLAHLPLRSGEEIPLRKGRRLSGYHPPEQRRWQPIAASDLYAVAATLHHALTGYDPRDGIPFFYPSARLLKPTISAHMEEILARALHPSIVQRYPNALSMQEELATLIASFHLFEGAY